MDLNIVFLAIERLQRGIFFVSAILFVLIIGFSEVSCVQRALCHTSMDIDISPIVSHAFLPIMVLSLIIVIVSYESAEYVHAAYLKNIGIITFIWSVFIIAASIIEFLVFFSLVQDEGVEDQWNSLTPLGQDYYDNDQSNLETEYYVNLILVVIFQAIVGVLLIVNGIMIILLYRKVPLGYLPRAEKEEQRREEIPPAQSPEPMRRLPSPRYRSTPEEEFDEQNPLSPQRGEIEMARLN